MNKILSKLTGKIKRIKPFYLAVLVVLFITVAAAVFILGSTARRRENLASSQKQDPKARLITRKVLIDGKEITAELASTPYERMVGLSYRTALKNGKGMLFTFGQEAEYPFWMKNMKIGLDLIWINADLEIIDLDENVPPCTQDNCENYTPSAPVKYVLEVPAGWSGSNGVGIGDRIEFPELIIGGTQP